MAYTIRNGTCCLASVAEERKERKIEKIRNRAPAPDRLVLLILRPRNRNEEPIA